MTDRGASTFYVDVSIEGAGLRQFLVDTGSSYTTINQEVLARLHAAGQAEYVKDLEGILADGTKQVVPVYTIKSLTVGEQCTIGGVQAAVFPGSTRNILGLSALRSTAPFVFSIDPPVLSLSNCLPAVPASGAAVVASGD
ncbi:MAG: retropepsin-like aspartic protease [Wenzhouxiangellaceae bacterium]|nr:retropepsin-like aspartic protease [Wenzhouxiangellaceae bacterium]